MTWTMLILPLAGLAGLVVAGTAALVYALTHPPRRTVGQAVARHHPTDPGEAAAAFTAESTRSTDGTEVGFWHVEGRARGGPALVMIHGWGDSRLGQLFWLEALRPVASRLLLYDQRGHGESPQRRFGWGLAETADVQTLVGWIRQRYPQTPIGLFGTSCGGAIAIRAAKAASPRVDAVVVDSLYRWPVHVVRRMMAQQALPTWPFVELACGWLSLRHPSFRQPDVAAAARELPVPLLLIHGEEDRLVPPDHARAVAEAAPRAHCVLFKGADHLEAVAVDPVQYTAILRRFFRDLAPRPPVEGSSGAAARAADDTPVVAQSPDDTAR